jgi:hypothetical protein
VVQFLNNPNPSHHVGFPVRILIHYSEDAPLSTTSNPKSIRALMRTLGSVTRLVIDLRSNDPPLGEAAARLV